MSNLFQRLANQVAGKVSAIKPQTSAAFFADAPRLKQEKWPGNSGEQSSMQTVDRHHSHPQHRASHETLAHHDGISIPRTLDPFFSQRGDAVNNTATTHDPISDKYMDRANPSSFASLIHPEKNGRNDRKAVSDAGPLNIQARSENNHPVQNRSNRFDHAADNASLTGLSTGESHANNAMHSSETGMIESDRQHFHTQTQQNQFRPLFKTEKNRYHQNQILAATINEQHHGKENNDTVVVHVSIGRIEVKAPRQQPTAVPKTTRKTAAPMSLEAYLANREGGKR